MPKTQKNKNKKKTCLHSSVFLSFHTQFLASRIKKCVIQTLGDDNIYQRRETTGLRSSLVSVRDVLFLFSLSLSIEEEEEEARGM
jgi:hypothetical protein